MKNLNTRLAVLLLFTLCLFTAAYGQITPSADSYTSSADPKTNYGAKTLLDVDGATQVAYVQFNLASIPAGASVSQATLKLFVDSVTTPGSFNVNYVSGPWSEGAITYELAPALGSTIASNVSIATEDKNQYILINVTPAVQAWLNGGEPNNGIALVANGAFHASFDSKENAATAHPPQLDIVFAAGSSLQLGNNDLICVQSSAAAAKAAGSSPAGEPLSGSLPMNIGIKCGGGGGGGGGAVTSVFGRTGAVTAQSGDYSAYYPLLSGANTFTGNQTVNGNLSATGMVTGSGFQIGSNLLDYGSYASGNAFLGFSGNLTITGSNNTSAGLTALSSNTSGSGNVANGYLALGNNTTGSNNTAAGNLAGTIADNSNITGSSDTAIGSSAALSTGSLTNATAVGANAEVGESNALVLGSINGVNGATASTSVGIGTITPAYTLDVHGTGNFTGLVNFASGQTFPGAGTITGVTGGTGLSGSGTSGNVTLNNTGILSMSAGTGISVSSGQNPTVSVSSAVPLLSANNSFTGSNTFTGNQTVNGNLSATGVVTGSSFNIGSNLFGFGSYSNNNAFLGFAGNPAVAAAWNTGVGYQALAANVGNENGPASWNTAIGADAMYNNNATTGQGAGANASGNTAVGYAALYYNTTGFNNTASGSFAGNPGDSSFLIGSNDTFMGYGSGPSTGTLSNVSAIGANALVAENNAMVLGQINGVNGATVNTAVGIGTTTPQTRLDVVGNNLDVFIGDPQCGSNPFAGIAFSANSGSGFNNCKGYSMVGDGTNTYVGAPTGTIYFRVNSNNTTAMTIAENGTVTIANLDVTTSLSKPSGTFKIDHPLDPANKYLYHSFVESPDMMDVYNGNVTTNKHGLVVVVLPEYFQALNRDFRYQLTVIGQFAQAIVAHKIAHNRFVIRTDKPGVEVSWQVTGIRQDAFANAHRVQVEVDKAPEEQGKYLHPELFGASAEQAIGYSVPPPSTGAARAQIASAGGLTTQPSKRVDR